MGKPDAIKFLVRIGYFAPFLAGLAMLNWVCAQRPVRNLFSATLDEAAEALIAGKTIRSRVDMRDLKPIWVEHWHESPDVIVLGSSRLAQVDGDWFRPRRMANLAMMASDFSDAVSILQECLDTGKAPKLVVLELNPTLTFEGSSQVAPVLEPHLQRALLHYRIFPPRFFSGSLTLDSLRWDPRILMRRNVWEVSDKIDRGEYRMRPDGSADWDLTVSQRTPAEVEQDVVWQMHNPDPAHLRWRTSSHPGWLDHKILLAFLDDMRARGIRVAVLLVPLHPTAYNFYSRQGGYDESWIRSDMEHRGVTVIGEFSPVAARATRDDFYDAVHPHAAVLRRLLQEARIIE